MNKLNVVLLMGILCSANSFAAQDINFNKVNLTKIDLRATVLQVWNEEDAELYKVLFTGENKGVFDLGAITYVQYEKMKVWQAQAPLLFTEMFATAWPESMRKDYVPSKRKVSPQDETPNTRLANNK